MKKMVGMLAAATALAGCETPLKPGEVAYRATDAIVIAKCPVTSDYGTNWFNAAAADLTNVLSKVTGRTIPLYWEDELPISNLKPQTSAKAVIYFGDTDAAKAAGIDTKAMKRMVFRIKSERGKTCIAANSATASSYGMTEFVERYCDYHFLTIHGDDPYTVNPALTIPAADLTVTPSFYWRKIWTQFLHQNISREQTEINNGDKKMVWRNYFRRTRTYGLEEEYDPEYRVTPQVKPSHNVYDYLPPEKYFKDHPEYYSLRKDGTRQAFPQGDVCMTHPDVRRIFTEKLLSFIEADRKANPTDYPLVYPISPRDGNPYFCTCPDCSRIVAKYNRKKGGNKEGGDTALKMDFVNDILRRVRAKYPDVRISTDAYVKTEIVPEGLAYDDNVIVSYCDLYSTTEELHPIEGTPINKEAYGKLVAWSKATKHLSIWDYRMVEQMPQVNIDALVSDLRLFKRCGADSFFMEHDYMYFDPFWELHHYLYTRLAMDLSLDAEALVDTFCRSYGKYAKEMRSAIDLMRAEIAKHPAENFSKWFNRDLGWRNRAHYERLLAIVKPCYDGETDPIRRGRLANVLRLIYKELIPIYYSLPDGKPLFDEARVVYRKYIDESYAVSEMPAGSNRYWSRLDKGILLKYEISFKDLPDALKDVPKGDLISIDSRFMMYPAEFKREDKTSETGMTIRYHHGTHDVKPPFKFDVMSSFGAPVYYDVEIPKENQDGKYHWYRFGPYHLGRYGKFHCPTFANGEKTHPARTPSFRLQDFYKEEDGIAESESPNWYDLWVSCKWSPKSAENNDDGFYVDRFVMRRVRRK